MSDPPDTLLVITGALGVSPYSARGLTQTLDLIDAATHLERDVNGGVVDLSPPVMRKYKSTITCTDVGAPAFGGLYTGALVTVDCVSKLRYPTLLPALQDRTVVPGSIVVEGDWTYYRPRLNMVVVGFSESDDEWTGETQWQLFLEEQ